MSKRNKAKRKNRTADSKKTVNKKKVIIPIVSALVIVAILVSIVIINLNSDTEKIKNELCKTKWIPVSAADASGDEVDMAQVYNTKYTSYKGSLEYFDDNTFSFWMGPGAPDDGTHSGKYEVDDYKTINMYFDDGTNTQFGIKCENNKAVAIKVNYGEYVLIFASDGTDT